MRSAAAKGKKGRGEKKKRKRKTPLADAQAKLKKRKGRKERGRGKQGTPQHTAHSTPPHRHQHQQPPPDLTPPQTPKHLITLPTPKSMNSHTPNERTLTQPLKSDGDFPALVVGDDEEVSLAVGVADRGAEEVVGGLVAGLFGCRLLADGWGRLGEGRGGVVRRGVKWDSEVQKEKEREEGEGKRKGRMVGRRTENRAMRRGKC